MTRRRLLAAGGCSLAASVVLGAGRAPRLAAIDWAMFETAQALGHAPVAAAELIRLRRETALPPAPGTVDLGLRGAPNLEALSLVAPDLVLSSNYYGFIEAQLSRIAPVFSRDLFLPGEAPLPRVEAALTALAERIGDPVAGQGALAAHLAAFEALATRARAFANRPLCVVEIGDAQHVRAFGADSLYGGALDRLGLVNAWREVTRFGFNAPVPLARLADFPEARIVIAGKIPVAARRDIARGALWNALPAVAGGRVIQLPNGNPFGGAASAQRFAAQLVAALEDEGTA
ncbi:ABC transporter substrate-binding protein [Oceanicola sp. S124]|uniref:ABC transporter substrate-binding protein n=1 Tax=Oceanicola sp. S124 TaxID=1042378 RepID=UPI001ED96248|nr:ABC transporter substrate-binding protein [Oceanicola sp. S124]